MWQALLLTLQLLILVVLGWGAYTYVSNFKKIRHWIRHCISNMDCDELIDQLLEQEAVTIPKCEKHDDGTTATTSQLPEGAEQHNKKRERLVALAAGGQARQYLGKALSTDQIDSMPDVDIEKLYARYEAYLGSSITKTLGTAALQLYAMVASAFLPIPPENQPELVHDLEKDPFVGHALSTATCELYHRYGRLLAPLTAALTTAKHCQFGGKHQFSTAKHDDDGCSSRTGTTPEDRGTAREGDPALGAAAEDTKV